MNGRTEILLRNCGTDEYAILPFLKEETKMSKPNDFLLELVPKSQQELYDVPQVKCRDGSFMSTYKFRRPPRFEELQQLQQLNDLWSIWQENNETLLLLGEMQQLGYGLIVYHDSLNSFVQGLTLANDNRRLQFSSGTLHYTIIGKSDYAIANTAAFLWELETDNRSIDITCWNGHFDFSVFTTEQLGFLVGNSPAMEITLRTLNISPVQSEFFAQLPFPISLTLEEGPFLDAFSDGGRAFVESLLRRQSPFVKLIVCHAVERHNETFQRLLEAKSLDYLEVLCATPQQTLQLLSSSIRGIGCTLDVNDLVGLDWSSVEIVPKELFVEIMYWNDETQIDFICSCLRRIAELGDFEKLDFLLMREEDVTLSTRVAEEFFHVLVANRNLVDLHLREVLSEVDMTVADLFAVVERHPSLRYLKVNDYPKEKDPDYALLKQLLERNRLIEVKDSDGNVYTDGDEMDRLCTFNRFFRNCHDLAQEPLSLLPLLIPEALTCSAISGVFQRSAILLANRPSVLCELVQFSSLFPLEADSFNVLEASAETVHAAAPQCETGSPAPYPCKRKRF